MREAINEAEKAGKQGEVPIGAVIVLGDKIIGRGHNRKEELNDPLSHAETEAIKDACNNIQDWRLNGSLIYVTAEPCIMCVGAIIHARISRVIFGAVEPKFGCVCSQIGIFDKNLFNHRVEWLSGICKDEITTLMQSFFKNIRGNNL